MRESVAAVCLLAACLPQRLAAGVWGGSLALTDDYLVRGISRSDHGVAVQGDLHAATDTGLIGGLFASTARFESGDRQNAELSGFVGIARAIGGAWRAKGLASYYAYAGSVVGARYDYAEFALEATYDDWLGIELVYSPDSPRYVARTRAIGHPLNDPDSSISGYPTIAGEFSLRSPWHRHVAASAGLGYARESGPGGGGYAYWSGGGTLDLSPLTVSLTYVDTSAESTALYYGSAAHHRWTATAIWRF